jgi:uncharacterized protein YoxC
MTDAPSESVALIAEGMARFREQMESNDRESLAISAKTKWIVKWSGVLLALMVVAVVLQILTMRSELLVMIRHLERMYADFQVMATNVDGMTGQVGSIQARVARLPHLATDVTAMNADVWGMRTAIGGMTGNVEAMSTHVTVLRDTTGEMTYHFRNVQQSVDYMNYNVGQMLRPLSVLPR